MKSLYNPYLIGKFDREWVNLLYTKDNALKTYCHALTDLINPDELETLIRENTCFIGNHGLTVSDIEKVLKYQEAIKKRAFSSDDITLLDNVQVFARDGKEYPNAIYTGGTTYRDDSHAICQTGGVHVSIDKDGHIYHSISGGSFPTINPKDLKRDGVKRKTFWLWGHNGACGNGGIYFKAKVKNWVLNDPAQY